MEGWFLEGIDNTDWMPPAISAQNGLVYVPTKVDRVYEYRAIDFKTGEYDIRHLRELPDTQK